MTPEHAPVLTLDDYRPYSETLRACLVEKLGCNPAEASEYAQYWALMEIEADAERAACDRVLEDHREEYEKIVALLEAGELPSWDVLGSSDS